MLILLNTILYAQDVFISPDGKKRVELQQSANNTIQVLVNSVPLGTYQRIANRRVYFVTDSFKVVYIASCAEGYRVVVNGKEGSVVNNIPVIVTYKSNRHWFYLGRNAANNYSFYCFDGIEQPRYTEIEENSLVFNSDSTHWAYLATKNIKQGYIVDGIEQFHNGKIKGTISFSPDGEHWAYLAQKGFKWFYIIDGEEQPRFDDISNEGIIFSSDSKNWVYYAYGKKEWKCITSDDLSATGDSPLCYTFNEWDDVSTSDKGIDFHIGFNRNYLHDFNIDECSITDGHGLTGYLGFTADVTKQIGYSIDFGISGYKTGASIWNRSAEDDFTIWYTEIDMYFRTTNWIHPYIFYRSGTSFKSRLDIDFGEINGFITDREFQLKMKDYGLGLALLLTPHIIFQGSVSYQKIKGNDTIYTFSSAGSLPSYFKDWHWNYSYGLKIRF